MGHLSADAVLAIPVAVESVNARLKKERPYPCFAHTSLSNVACEAERSSTSDCRWPESGREACREITS